MKLKYFLNAFYQLCIFTFLTIISQIGGIIYFISLFLNKRVVSRFRFKFSLIFISLYLLSTFLLVPLLAPLFGRELVKHSDRIKPTNYLTVLLNRNYVRPALNDLLSETEKELGNTKVQIHYLDANFPFINKFPLLPHLSHNDGKKIDLSLIYETKKGNISSDQKSRSGYGVFEGPKPGEVDQIQQCINKGYIQYDFTKFLSLGSIHQSLVFSEKGTKELINSLLKNLRLGKIFIEPHLKQRLELNNKKVRFHGCQAVRHDDHIHVQLK